MTAGAARCDAVVVLSFFGRQDTLRCVASLVQGSPSARVLVIDNGSFDGALEEIQARWPALETIQISTNRGFSGGMNVGLRWARSIGADTITVLNNDTIVPPGVIAALSETAMAGAAVSPEVRYADGGLVWFGGATIDRGTNLPRHLSDREITDLFGSAPQPALRAVSILAGCCICASVDVWRRVGGFNEDYFLNFEDSDWSVRAHLAGVSLVVDPRIHIFHRVSASFTGGYRYLGMYYYARNGLHFGRSMCGGGLGSGTRFVRGHVLPGFTAAVRGAQWSEASRRATVISCALVHHMLGRYGRAPAWLEAATTRWPA